MRQPPPPAKYHWVPFVLTVYCWAGDLPMNRAYKPSKSIGKNDFFPLQAIVCLCCWLEFSRRLFSEFGLGVGFPTLSEMISNPSVICTAYCVAWRSWPFILCTVWSGILGHLYCLAVWSGILGSRLIKPKYQLALKSTEDALPQSIKYSTD